MYVFFIFMISLIIAVYNHPEFLNLVFASLQNQTYSDFEIVIADDGSSDDIKSVISAYRVKLSQRIAHVWHEDNGFRKTIIANKAVLAAQGDYLIFIDGDSILHHRFIERHFLRKQPRQALTGRRVMFDEYLTKNISVDDILAGRMEQHAFFKNHALYRSDRFRHYLPLLSSIERFFKKNYSIHGCNFSLYKEDYLRVNGYDEDIIGRGLEDNNLCARLKLSGTRVVPISREALQYHLHHSSKPIPHSKEVIAQFGYPTHFWAEHGIIKQPSPLG